jgi:hypothetical protein
MKTKIMAGVAIAAIAATGVVGGFALANGDLNSGVNATNSKTIVFDGSSNKASTLNANYNATKLSSGTLAGDSVVVAYVGGAANEEINLTSTANYCAATPDSGYGASVTFNAGCTGLTSISSSFTGSATYITYTSSSMITTTGSGNLSADGSAVTLQADSNFIVAFFSLPKDSGALTVTSITLNWAC